MATTLASKGQVMIPKRIRTALNPEPGCAVEFAVNHAGEVVIHKARTRTDSKLDRFASARGKADINPRYARLSTLLPRH